MHSSALKTGEIFFRAYEPFEFKNVLDIGGRDYNGSLRRFAPSRARFVAVDLEPGRGVDLVLDDPHTYPFGDGHFDAIVSTSCLEHDRMFWLTILEAVRVLSNGGVLYLNVPSQGAYHGYPFDNWRFYPDASLAIVDWCARLGRPVSLVESFNHPDMPFNDCVMVFTKATPQRRPPLLHERIPGAYNIRIGGTAAVVNPRLETPALELVSILGQEIERLRARLATYETGAAAD